MRPELQIAEPCTLDVTKMPKCKTGFYCTGCRSGVTDLRKKDAATISDFVEKNPGACVIMESRHLTGKKTWWWAENMVHYLKRYKLARLAAVCLGICMFLSSCHRHRRFTTTGCPSFKQTGAQQKTEHMRE